MTSRLTRVWTQHGFGVGEGAIPRPDKRHWTETTSAGAATVSRQTGGRATGTGRVNDMAFAPRPTNHMVDLGRRGHGC